MAYVSVDDFALGLDLRKSAVTAKPGSLRVLRNAFVNAGGEIEKRKAFARLADLDGAALPSFGLGAVPAGPVVFSADGTATTPVPIPEAPSVLYQSLPGVSLGADRRVTSVEYFDGKLYVVTATPTANTYEHWYDGARVTAAPASAFAVRGHKSKLYAISETTLHFSAVNNPLDWSGAGSGLIRPDPQGGDVAPLTGLGVYYDKLVLFGRQAVQIWAMDPDPALNQLVQVLDNTGLIAPLAHSRFGSGDVLFMHDSGIRSLRARDSSNSALVNDLGAPLDDLLRPRALADVLGATPAQLGAIRGDVDPYTGQFWLSWRDQVFVLSQAPASQVTAWGVFEPGFVIDTQARSSRGRLYFRAGNTIFVYGGTTGNTYDRSEAEVLLPMVDAGTPATRKVFTGLDVACEGTWTVEIGTDPARPDDTERAAVVSGPTFGRQKIALAHTGTHITARFRSTTPSRARLGRVVFHYEQADAT